MDAKIPPDIILLSCGTLMWLLARYLPGFGFEIGYHAVLALIIFLSGLVIIFSAKATLYKHGTTERPGRRSLPEVSTLVTTGIYGFSRNPVYLGMAVLLIGWTVMLTNWTAIIGVAVFAGVITGFQIIPEEKTLEYVFGDEYRRYKSRVRRWI
ncbi:methyltransferase family protein [Parapedobacter deserti]|uniref:Methyltransferase family protein n=2 Tax=Parapedobacter deserti TaxID=1912957 RepID=A0ABV7JNJ4_9SPHI